MLRRRMVHVLSFVLCLLAAAGGADRRFEVTASRYKFEPPLLEVTEGERVLVTLRSNDVEHGWAIKKLKLKTVVPSGGQAVHLEFVAGKPGTYVITCSEYCGKGHSRMTGKLVVKPRAAPGGGR
ncbi:MAG TPA: cupredoxin domain-containing protein [Vicinamibacteria bacterium]|nr:cupredoxin domain-containing protein [Vicinamibacteria bacterium]